MRIPVVKKPNGPPAAIEGRGRPAAGQPSVEKASQARKAASDNAATREIGGYTGAEPTRFGDWEKNGRCIDF